ncbi:MAG: YIP1 family protein [Phenylobacterium sp.]|uniref:Yip1 family protein n=1 Tax=Phenylobacterium sp. TaxID=1871053 RepID=UPI001A3A9373|nr:Yip1 family protein [Phenylobacterium sp.]MBL8553333.1 YIP1 family protein [Phenylobacterium sp.]
MSMVEPGSAGSGLIARVRLLLAQPSAAWDVIDGEPATVGGLYRNYVLPLAAIPAVAGLVGQLAFGVRAGFGGFGVAARPDPVWAVAGAVASFGLGLLGVYLMALVIDGFAPNFGAEKNRVQAMKLAAYAPTASYVAGALGLVAGWGLLGFLVGVTVLVAFVYSLYTLYQGLPKLMKSDPERTVGYFVVVLVVAFVLGLMVSIAYSAVSGVTMRLAGPPKVSGKVTIPGQGEIDVGELQKQAEAAARRIEAGKDVAATDTDALKSYLPASLGGYARGEVSASSSEAAGMKGSQVEARYVKGVSSIRLQITDIGGAGALAGMMGAFKVRSSKESDTGYETFENQGGRMTHESYDRSSKRGEYGVLVGERFMVEAKGDGASMPDLKDAVNAVDLSRLEALAKAG